MLIWHWCHACDHGAAGSAVQIYMRRAPEDLEPGDLIVCVRAGAEILRGHTLLTGTAVAGWAATTAREGIAL